MDIQYQHGYSDTVVLSACCLSLSEQCTTGIIIVNPNLLPKLVLVIGWQ